MQFLLNILAQTKTQNWLWLIGLTVGTLAVIFFAFIILKKFRQWLKSDIPVPGRGGSAFRLEEIKEMKDKGLISNEEYTQLKNAYINCH